MRACARSVPRSTALVRTTRALCTRRAASGSSVGHRTAFRSLVPVQKPCVLVRSQHSEDCSGPHISEFFDREHERKQIELLLQGKPTGMRIVLGPRNCGKSALFNRVAREWDNVVVLDMRALDTTNPEHFLRTLLEKIAAGWAQTLPRSSSSESAQAQVEAIAKALQGHAAVRAFLTGVGSVRLTPKNVSGSLAEASLDFSSIAKALAGELKLPDPAQEGLVSLGAFKAAARTLLESWAQASRSRAPDQPLRWPLLIVDEANMLTDWQDEHPKQLKSLLQWIIMITKQENLCHLFLATSDWGFKEWVEQAIGLGFFRTEAVGDFPEQDARKFFELELQLQQRSVNVVVDDTAWHLVHQVCGGNAGYLRQLAEEVAINPPINQAGWDAALQRIRANEVEALERLARSKPGAGWTRPQFAAAALAVLEAPGNAVPVTDMELLLGLFASNGPRDVAGEEVLARLIQADAFAKRPASDWAQDIPATTFVDWQPVVTAASPVGLHCMRRKQQQFRETVAQAMQGIQADLRVKGFTELVEAGKVVEAMAFLQGSRDLMAKYNAEPRQLGGPSG